MGHTVSFLQNVGRQLKTALGEALGRLGDDIEPGLYTAAVVDEKYKNMDASRSAWMRRVGRENIFLIGADMRAVSVDGSRQAESFDPLGHLMLHNNLVLEAGANAGRSLLEYGEISAIPRLMAKRRRRWDLCVPTQTSDPEPISEAVWAITNFRKLVIEGGGIPPRIDVVLNAKREAGAGGKVFEDPEQEFTRSELDPLLALCADLGITPHRVSHCPSKLLQAGRALGMTAKDVNYATSSVIEDWAMMDPSSAKDDHERGNIEHAKEEYAKRLLLMEKTGLSEVGIERDRTFLQQHIAELNAIAEDLLFEGFKPKLEAKRKADKKAKAA
jgi:hypothetical protein